MTFGTLAGKIISDGIMGRQSKVSEILNPSRVRPLASVARFAIENMNAARWLMADWLSRDDHAFISEIPRGEGRLIEGPFQKIAVYKDERGQVSAMSPVCGHLGGIVHWNEAEKTWDCPCHGSRYAPNGELLCGPSMKDLDPLPFDENQSEGEEAVVDGRDLPQRFLRQDGLGLGSES